MLDPLLAQILAIILIIPAIIIVALVKESDFQTSTPRYRGRFMDNIPCSESAGGYICLALISIVVIWEFIFTGTERSIYYENLSQSLFSLFSILLISVIIAHVCGAPLRLCTKARVESDDLRPSSSYGIGPRRYTDGAFPPMLVLCPNCREPIEVIRGERGICYMCGHKTDVVE